jgi:hypothetical protein
MRKSCINITTAADTGPTNRNKGAAWFSRNLRTSASGRGLLDWLIDRIDYNVALPDVTAVRELQIMASLREACLVSIKAERISLGNR